MRQALVAAVVALSLAVCGAAGATTASQHLQHARRVSRSAHGTLRFFARRPRLVYGGPLARRRTARLALRAARWRLKVAGRERRLAEARIVAERPYTSFRVTATEYAPGCGDSGRTATGTVPHWGTVAVDPSLIRLGSRLWVQGYGWARAEDTGGAIDGFHVDLWVPSCSQATTRHGVLVRVYH